MTAKQRLDLPHALYYVELKSNGQRTLFPDRSLFGEFIQLLSQLQSTTGSKVLCYSLLQSSVHLVLEAGNEGIQSSAQILEQQYTQIYNDFLDRHGSVFHKYTPCVLLEPRRYLAPVIKQIHVLAVQQGLVATSDIYPWSSHNGYTGSQPCAWLDTSRLLNQLSQQRASKLRRYELFMKATNLTNLELAQGNHTTHRALASREYIDKLLSTAPAPSTALVPTLAWLQEQVCSEYQLGSGELKLWRRHRLNREIKSVITLLAHTLGTATIEDCAAALQEPVELLENGGRLLESKRQLFLHELEQRLRHRLDQEAATNPTILQMPTTAEERTEESDLAITDDETQLADPDLQNNQALESNLQISA